MFWPHMGGAGWASWIAGGLLLALLVGLLIALLVVLLRSSGNTGSNERHVGPNQALELLKQRYARGEITRDEYETMRRDILA